MCSAVLGQSLRQKHALATRCATAACCRRSPAPAAAPASLPTRPPPTVATAAALPLHGLSRLLHGRWLLVVLLPRRLRCIRAPCILIHALLNLCLPLLLLLQLRCLPARRSRLLRVMLVENVQRPCPPNVPQPQLAVAAARGKLPLV